MCVDLSGAARAHRPSSARPARARARWPAPGRRLRLTMHPTRGPVLRARLRRRHVQPDREAGPRRRGRHPQRAGRRPPDRRRDRGHRERPRDVLPAPTASTRSRPTGGAGSRAARGRGRRRLRRPVPGRRRLEHHPGRVRHARTASAGPRRSRPRPSALHFIVAAARWMDFRTQIKDAAGHPGRAAAGRPDATPRSTAGSRRTCRRNVRAAASSRPGTTSSPACRASTATRDAGTLGSGVDDLIARVSSAWKGPNPPKLRLLPDEITLEEVRQTCAATPARAAGRRRGRARRRSGRTCRSDPHLYLFGDSGVGQVGDAARLSPAR